MPHRFDTREKQRLLDESRYEALHPEQLLRRLGLKEGDTMADIGCGPGFFTVPAAEIVGPQGTVYAADVQGEMLSAVKSRVVEQGLTNVHVVKTSETDVPLPQSSVDFVLLAFVLNEVEHRSSFLHRLARVLKPNGRIIVIEWQKRQQEVGPPLVDRLSPEEVLSDAQAAGLTSDQREDLNDNQYLATFTANSH